MLTIKKRMGAAAVAVLCMAALVCPTVMADNAPQALPVDVPAPSAILIDGISGEVLFEKNADEQMPPASVTKIMTLLLTMEAIDAGKMKLEDMVSVSEHASSMGGSQIWLEVGEQMSVNDLLKATAISSANDASVALGENISGSEDTFVALMNQRAKELGMNNTVFKNASGLDEDGHVTTARDIAIMSKELLSHPLIKQYSTVWMDTLRGGETSLVNTNKLVRFYEGTTGLKTGTTDSAGYCLSASAERNGLSLISVVMGAKTSEERFASARTLLDYGFANWQVYTPKPLEKPVEPVKVVNGTESTVAVESHPMAAVVIKKGQEQDIEYKVEVVKDVQAPVALGQTLGRVVLYIGDKEIGSYPLTAVKYVGKLTFWVALQMLWANMLNMK
ncbi:D-alanyl-D-alanine carboxypeptidase family protein [Acetanaerobacterium elongatum]|uniref:serine-type D-Ala-D-Ala carboxypeptidase n=1 Tax=Acetanaerobacterium elongatum TaxID=258515 RepID=A0A1G9WYN3_9FIRM|nr:D-alanyl-D-alanine carboxypeptidase family protein [Acetanaerobacterium elongatum]SDM89632.1 D-alanyl-D-alanine carboxypeptidase (penicillin-binding protein 5/6) [Acetanaerobacterium elongatum]